MLLFFLSIPHNGFRLLADVEHGSFRAARRHATVFAVNS
jgi:hypothetical protein